MKTYKLFSPFAMACEPSLDPPDYPEAQECTECDDGYMEVEQSGRGWADVICTSCGHRESHGRYPGK